MRPRLLFMPSHPAALLPPLFLQSPNVLPHKGQQLVLLPDLRRRFWFDNAGHVEYILGVEADISAAATGNCSPATPMRFTPAAIFCKVKEE